MNCAILTSPPSKKPPKQISIREAEGGFIVSDHGDAYPSKDKVYHSVDELLACVEKKFGKKGAKKEEAEEE